MSAHPIFERIFADMARVGLIPKTDRQLDHELEPEGVCVFPPMDRPSHNFANPAEENNDA